MRLLRWATALVVMAVIAGPVAGAGRGWRWHLPAGVMPPAVPADNGMTAEKVELGRRLFYDADLSVDGTMACATCHEQKHGFADGNITHAGVHGDPGRRNVPGLANVGWRTRLTWADPSLLRLEDQVAVPVSGTSPVEMGMKGREAEIGDRLGADPCYRRMFADAFPERGGAIDMGSVSAALAAFQRSLLSFDSPYDRYRRGQARALSAAAQRGADDFFGRSGCVACHSGPDITDGDYHAVGTGTAHDPGLSEKTGQAEDAGRFRTPSLRNVAVTGPWLHDGSAATLAVAIARHQGAPDAGRLADLIAFLDSMTDRTFLIDRRFALPDRACGKRL